MSQFLSEYNVTTTTGEAFTGQETALLYALISKRMGGDRESTAHAVAKMMGYCGDPSERHYQDQVAELVTYGRPLLKRVEGMIK